MILNKLKKSVKRLIKQSIIFESIPAFSDNTRPVYDELVRRGFNKKYNLIWNISQEQCAILKNGRAVYWDNKSKKSLIRTIRNYSYSKPKCIICCNAFLPATYFAHSDEVRPISFYLSHGTPMKSVRAYYSAPEGIDYSLSPAPALNKVMSEEFNIPIEKIFAAGFPRNDVFAHLNRHINEVFGWNYNKVIIWYPTYRQNKSHSIDLSGNSLPLIYDENNAKQLNDEARNNNVLIILKPHHAQDVSLIKEINFSNIMLIDDQFFTDNHLTSYELLAGSDALITDYSSVYFDYTLRDKPIGVIWEDIEAYKVFPGFALDIDYYLKGAEKIYTIDELCSFVSSVSNDEDHLQNERREIRDICNYANDGMSAKRVVDFIVDKAAL